MAEFLSLPLDQIAVPEQRVRKVNDNKAFLIGQSIAAGTQIGPITVRPTPEKDRPYELVVGATRYRGHELHGLKVIDCLARELTEADARRMEIEENLFRDDLNMLERALHVVEYRKLWEDGRGAINPKGGRPAKAKTDPTENSAQGHFFEQALDDLGLSRRAIERAQFIGANLQQGLREALRGSPEANNQSLLDKLARLEPAEQKTIAKSFGAEPDIKKALAQIEPERFPDSDRDYTSLVAAWNRAGKRDRDRFLAFVSKGKRD